MIAGLVLAGGRSRRFGREKAVEPLAGRPLIAWVVARLAGSASSVAVSARLGSGAEMYAEGSGLTVLPDPADGALAGGPLAGVAEGLRWAKARGAGRLLTAPCDTPFLPCDYVGRLVAAAGAGGAVARTAEGLQPLCALWPVEALEVLEAERSHPPIRAVLARIGAAEAAFPDASAFDNLNTPEAFAAAAERLAAAPSGLR